MSLARLSRSIAKTTRVIPAAGLLGAWITVGAQTVTFAGSGLVTGPAQVPPVFTQLRIEPATTLYTFNGVSGWTLDVLFQFNAATLSGSGAGTFAKGVDSLAFTITSTTASLGAPLALSYVINGGSGSFAGVSGTGGSQVQLLGDPLGLPTPIPFIESNGMLTLAAIPEPSQLALFAVGLAAFVARVRRRPARDQ